MRALEAEIGGDLLVRSTRRVELTEAGAALLSDARVLIADADRTLERVRSLARGEAGTLTLGSLGPAPGDLLAPTMARFAAEHPQVRLEIRNFDFGEFVEGVRERQVDLAFIYLPFDDPKVETLPLVTENRVVVLPVDHPLATRAELSPADLKGERFVTQPQSIPEPWRHFWLLVEQMGEIPEVHPHVPGKVEDWLSAIGRAEGIDTAPAVISRYYSWPEVAFVPLVDAPPATLALAWRRDSANPLVTEFAEAAGHIAALTARNGHTAYRIPA